MGFKLLKGYAGENVSHTVGNTGETHKRDPGDRDRPGIIYLPTGDR